MRHGQKTTEILDHRDGLFCVLVENALREKEFLPIRTAAYAEVQTLLGRTVRCVNEQEGIYADEEGNVYELMEKGATKPIAVQPAAGSEKSELETLLENSLRGGKTRQTNGDTNQAGRRFRSNQRKPKTRLQVVNPTHLSSCLPHPEVQPDSDVGKAPQQLNLRQKLAEVRRRIGYVQKRGHNERGDYSYVTAADIAGSIGDLLSELGVVVIPRLENITYESAASRGETTRMAQVVMAYTFADVDSGEEIVTKVAGQGLDPGDKAPYKAMTGALKYALLQSFLLATGDDPEDDRLDGRGGSSERRIALDEIRTLKTLIEETGTELERVLAYYKLASLEEMTETTYRRALEVLSRKLAQRGSKPETVHAQD